MLIDKKRRSIKILGILVIFLLVAYPVVSAIYLNDIEDVDTDSAVSCNLLHYNGTMWVNYDLWNQSITWYNPHIFLDIINASAFYGDGGNLTNITLSLPSYLNSNAHPHNQDLNSSNNVLFAKVTATFFGDGGNITNVSASLPVYLTSTSHPHNQDLNTSNSPTFNDLTLSLFPNIDKDSTNDMTSFIGHPHNQDLNTTSQPTFATLNTGNGNNELWAMNQAVRTTDGVTFYTVNTGQGANELYDMDQNVQTTDTVYFNDMYLATGDTIGFVCADTSDGSDNNYIEVAGGGGGGGYARGSYIILYGNEYTGANGVIQIGTGDNANAVVIFLDSGSEYARFHTNNYLGLGDNVPDYRIELPNTASDSGRGRANQWATYSDNRIKNFIKNISNDKLIQLYNEIKIQYYNPINNSQDSNGVISIGEIDYNKLCIGVDAQDLYKRFLRIGLDIRLINQIIYKPLNDKIDYWAINYDMLELVLIEGCRLSILENMEHIKDMELFLKNNYGYNILNWDYK